MIEFSDRLFRCLAIRSILSAIFAAALFVGVPDQAHAVAIGSLGPLKLGYFSMEWTTTKTTKPDGTVIETTTWGLDPTADEEITEIGVHLSFDTSVLTIVEDPLSYGFYCEYSSSGFCPDSMDGFPSPDTDPSNSGIWNFTVDNDNGIAKFSADWSANPITSLGEHFFFGFQTINDKAFNSNPFTQELDSPDHYCLTTESNDKDDNRCGSAVALPGTLWLLSAGMFAVFGLSLVRRST